jgi:hydroxypyruvate isomerase
MLFNEVPFIERFDRAKGSGFAEVEFLFPYADGLEAVKAAVKASSIEVVLFNLPAGDWEGGERGIAILPDRREEFRDGVGEAIRFAESLGTPRLNCLAGKQPKDLTDSDAEAVLVENLRFAAKELAKAHLELMIEPINSYDIPGFFLTGTSQALDLIERVGEPNIKIQYDIYHMQRMQGEILGTFRQIKPKIGHIQIADNPGRHQPGTGELNYRRIFAALEEGNYQGYVGLEYIPLGTTEDSLEWLRSLKSGNFAG